MSSPQIAPNNLSPTQASFVYWFNGLAQVATNIVTPLIVYWRMQKMPQAPLVKYNQQINEVVRQFISGTIGLVSYFGGGELTRGLINSHKETSIDDSSKHVAMIAGGILASFIGFAFVRPYVSTNLICKFLKQEQGVEAMFSDKEVLDIIERAQIANKPGALQDTFSANKAKELLQQKKKALVAVEAGAKSKHWLLSPLQNWVDRHLVPNGKPDLVKLARYSTLALTGYLTALTLLMWGLNRSLGRKHVTQAAPPPKQPVYPTLPALPMATFTEPHRPMQQLYYGNQWQSTKGDFRTMPSPSVRGLYPIW